MSFDQLLKDQPEELHCCMHRLAHRASMKLLRSSIMMASGSSSRRWRHAAIFCKSAAVDKYLH